MKQGFEATTRDIMVEVQVFYLDDQSSPAEGQFVWAYHVSIINHGTMTIQLLRRSWRITDAHGRIRHVHGEGVVGEQPILTPGKHYNYTSGAVLAMPSGFMAGQYHMREMPSGALFDVEIPAFNLDSPHGDNRRH